MGFDLMDFRQARLSAIELVENVTKTLAAAKDKQKRRGHTVQC
jgi:hypothetical protein